VTHALTPCRESTRVCCRCEHCAQRVRHQRPPPRQCRYCACVRALAVAVTHVCTQEVFAFDSALTTRPSWRYRDVMHIYPLALNVRKFVGRLVTLCVRLRRSDADANAEANDEKCWCVVCVVCVRRDACAGTARVRARACDASCTRASPGGPRR
jgi:hypothetical protein